MYKYKWQNTSHDEYITIIAYTLCAKHVYWAYTDSNNNKIFIEKQIHLKLDIKYMNRTIEQNNIKTFGKSGIKVITK